MDEPETDAEVAKQSTTVMGGRHGSPTVTIALPFSNITGADPELRAAVADLALLVSRLAREGSADPEERSAIAKGAADLAALLTDR